MCGIVGYLDKTGNGDAPLGHIALKMLTALGCRGPDSAGAALYASSSSPQTYVLRIKLGERGTFKARGKEVADHVGKKTPIRESEVIAEYLRLVVEYSEEPAELERWIRTMGEDLEVVSMGSRLEIVKQVGSPENLESSYRLSAMTGSHAIGHTRLSTESRVDLSHSQPFWAHGLPDVATVHNGHITNYNKLRRQYEQRGVRFYTENDSEVIGVFLSDRMSHGASFEQALRESQRAFDGSFSYLAADANSIAFVKDAFGLKPMMVAETDEFVAIATEEVALRRTFQDKFKVVEPPPGTMKIWRLGHAGAGIKRVTAAAAQKS